LVGATDVLLQDRSWPEAGASVGEWIAAFEEVGNDLEAPAMRIQPVIGEVLAALGASAGARLTRMSGSGATCFAIFENATEAQAAAETIKAAHPGWWVHAGALS
jgi:4-diphosphocytidyl-2-C-methyl-D-erythritol kinase